MESLDKKTLEEIKGISEALIRCRRSMYQNGLYLEGCDASAYYTDALTKSLNLCKSNMSENEYNDFRKYLENAGKKENLGSQ